MSDQLLLMTLLHAILNAMPCNAMQAKCAGKVCCDELPAAWHHSTDASSAGALRGSSKGEHLVQHFED